MENKERISTHGPETTDRRPILTDLRSERNLPPEVRHWMEKIETQPQNVVRDNQGQPVLTPSQSGSRPGVIKISSPKSAFTNGFKKKVDDVGLWLSTFIFRLIKKNKDKLIELEDG